MNLPGDIIEYILSFNRFHRIEFSGVLNQLEYLSNEFYNLKGNSKLAMYYRLPNTYDGDINNQGAYNIIMNLPLRLASYTSNIRVTEYILLKTNQKKNINKAETNNDTINRNYTSHNIINNADIISLTNHLITNDIDTDIYSDESDTDDNM